MPVDLTVRAVRDALYRAESGMGLAGEGAPSTALLGQWFHEGLGWLVGEGAQRSPLAVLADVDADLVVWKQTLAQTLYSRFLGPRLSREQALLHPVAPRVLPFWHAMQGASDWIAELCWSLRPTSRSRRTALPAPWQSLAEIISLEVPLECQLKEPGWTDSVRLIGVADAVVRLAPTGAWCAIELKLGRTSPVVDLGQACLYHLLLSTLDSEEATRNPTDRPAPGGGEPGTLAVVSFHPERQERLYTAAQLVEARGRLIQLIGKLAGVEPAPNGGRSTDGTGAGSTAPGSRPAPPVDPPTVPGEDHFRLGKQLVETLAEYKVQVQMEETPIAGPTFLRFPLTLGRGMRVRAVEKLAAELQVRLGLESEPFILREQGRLVIDVQRPDRQTVPFSRVEGQLPQADPLTGGAIVPIGVDLTGRLQSADLSRPEHAHLLVAGTTGSGKSEWLRLALAGLMIGNTPETLRLLVIDPKRNAFQSLQGSPFLWRPLVFPDEQSAGDVLAELAVEMDARYRLFNGDDSILQYMRRTGERVPRIVCVCDEYRDLITRSRPERKRIEEQICRLGAKARAAGIHLILATQEPSRDTIRGTLDANIPARVGLKMQKRLESNMLLNEPGAEKLLNHGDLLFKDVGPPRRLQAPLLSEGDRNRIFAGR